MTSLVSQKQENKLNCALNSNYIKDKNKILHKVPEKNYQEYK